MTEFRFPHISALLPYLMEQVLAGDELGSRAGRVREILHPHIVLERPQRREVLTPLRRAALPAQIAETMWVLAGRNDVAWLQRYLPRAADYSDDGLVWRGAYGQRLRRWGPEEIDQLAYVVELLRADHSTRRAVMSIYDPSIDSADGKDIPCNNWLHFTSRLGHLHLHVATRSNDLMWGWSGINAFEWSALQEIVAGLLGLRVGELHFSITSLHLYEQHWSKASNIAASPVPDYEFLPSPAFEFRGHSVDQLDDLIGEWFEMEERIRNGQAVNVDAFPEPMLRSWLRVIGWWWSRDLSWLEPLEGTDLYAAALLTPAWTNPFVDYVSTLHAEKHAIYGDSWKRRGELIGILANIARKIDRLGVGGAGDTAADTVIDLLCYLVKYRLWLTDHRGAPSPVTGPYEGLLSDRSDTVTAVLRSLPVYPLVSPADLPAVLQDLSESFTVLENNLPRAAAIVDEMIPKAARAARLLWAQENR